MRQRIVRRRARRGAVGVLLCFAAGLLSFGASAQARHIELPELGDASSAFVSPVQERRLGEAWLRMFRSRVPTVNDPLLTDYLEHLLARLAAVSQLSDTRLSLVVVRNPSINAFAVPGGVVGIHDGLLLHAQHEDELGAVLAHELAHLSQRHFARGVEQQARSGVPNMLALLSSIVIAATVGGDAGLAAMTATQAAAQQSRLRFSRQNEQEADRIGMQTLANAGMDPEAMPRMFERMLDATRLYGSRPPEFLLTHPVTESRVADSRARATRLPPVEPRIDLGFQLMRTRIQLRYDENASYSIKRFEAELENQRGNLEAHRYGLALAQLEQRNLDAARDQLAPLLATRPDRLEYLILEAEIDTAAGYTDRARRRLEGLLRLSPDNHPLTMALAGVLQRQRDYAGAAQLLAEHAQKRPDDPQVWYELAELNGLTGDILGVHKARAEFFVLTGSLDQAQRQLGYALDMTRGDFLESQRVQARISDIQTMREELD